MVTLQVEKQAERAVRHSAVREAFQRAIKNKEVLIGLIIVVPFLITAAVVEVASFFDILITPYDPIEQNVGSSLGSPSFSHLFGLDVLGRDVFSRVFAATPSYLAVSLAVVAVGLAVGVLVGSFAAFRGGLVDEVLMRFTDVMFALPALLIAMVIAVALGPGITHMMMALMVIWWPPYARVARGEALRVSHQNYIEAARLSAQGTIKTVFRHVLPNISGTMLVYATLDVGTVILIYAGLSYLGLSARPPQPDIGEIISSSQEYMISAPWLPLIPGLIVAVVVVGFSLLGDGLRDLLETS